jgi:large subunit ribosomal protein L17
MRHLKSGRKLGMPKSHRDSLLANLATSILDKERIITTLAKAKEARSVVERLITFGKKGGLNSIRHAGKTITDKTILHKLFTDIAPSFKDREGGYTRIIKLGERKGDNALLVIFELTGRGGEEIARLRKKQRKQIGTPGSTQAAGTGQASAAKTEKTPPVKAEKPVKTKAADKPKEEKPKAEKPKAAKVKATAPEEGASGGAEGSPEKKVSAAPQTEKTKAKKAPKAEAEKPKKAPKEKKK